MLSTVKIQLCSDFCMWLFVAAARFIAHAYYFRCLEWMYSMVVCKHNTKACYFFLQNERTYVRRIITILFVNLCCLEINLKSKIYTLLPHFVLHYFPIFKFITLALYQSLSHQKLLCCISHEITWANWNNHFVFYCSTGSTCGNIITTMRAIFFR